MKIDLTGITNITDDSRKIEPGGLFVAIKGITVDANKFIPDVIDKGAKIIVSDEKPEKSWLHKVQYIQVADARQALGEVASKWNGSPSNKLTVVGVTGTDGKTTTTSLIHWILEQSGKKAGVISTINARVDGKVVDTGFHVTNPEPLMLQKLLAQMVTNGCEYAVLEVTSHGIDQKRIAGVKFEYAVLTNITHEHLDYHKTFANYTQTKAKLFQQTKKVILNADDESVKYILSKLTPEHKVSLYSMDNVSNIKITDHGMSFIVTNKYLIRTKLLGKYNIYNILAAISVALKLGIPMIKIQAAIATFSTPEGRMQEVKNIRGVKIIVDFAHTPSALENVLKTLRIFVPKNKKLIVVFGCAGERDKSKRPMMGAIASKLSDIAIITAEDPRNEDVSQIIAEINAGVSGKAEVVNEPDRKMAINLAINKYAQKGDTVVICGKGHEKSMCYGTTETPWSDYQEAIKASI